MKLEKNSKNNPRKHRIYKAAVYTKTPNMDMKKMPSDEQYLTDLEKIRNALLEIEEKYYSTNIKIEQIEKIRGYEIIISKIAQIFSRKLKAKDRVGDNKKD